MRTFILWPNSRESTEYQEESELDSQHRCQTGAMLVVIVGAAAAEQRTHFVLFYVPAEVDS